MNTKSLSVSRREFLKSSSLIAAGAAVAPYVITAHAAPDDPIRIGLIGCGSRGMGAAVNALTAGTNIKLVAIGDLFADNLKMARAQLKALASGPSQAATWAPGTESKQAKLEAIELDDDHCFSGFDAYKKVIAVPEVNYVICTTPPHFRHIHLRAAVEAGKNAFIEKPVAVDPVGVRSIIESGEMAKKKNLGIVAGTQRRHHIGYIETIKRLQDGIIGEVQSCRVYWNQGGAWVKQRQPTWTDMEWQLRNWPYFTWLAGDIIVEQHLHNIDVASWVLGAHPVKAYAMGGRQVRTGAEYGYIYDHFTTEFIYPNDVRVFSQCRQIDNCSNMIQENVAGTKGSATCNVFSINVKGEKPWRFRQKFSNPYDQEHVDLIKSIRDGQPLNEAQQVAESNLAAIMARESAYSGQMIDWDSAMESKLDLSPPKYEFGPLPVPPVAMPGVYKFE